MCFLGLFDGYHEAQRLCGRNSKNGKSHHEQQKPRGKGTTKGEQPNQIFICLLVSTRYTLHYLVSCQAKTQTLVEKCGVVSHLNSERCLQLERAQSLASQFWETYEELSPWLQETLKAFNQLPPPTIEYDTLRQQQEELRVRRSRRFNQCLHSKAFQMIKRKNFFCAFKQMRELIAEHKPHIDKMNKTGPQLLELSPKEGLPIREKYTTSEQLYTKLKMDVKQRAAELDEAISKSTQVNGDLAMC